MVYTIVLRHTWSWILTPQMLVDTESASMWIKKASLLYQQGVSVSTYVFQKKKLKRNGAKERSGVFRMMKNHSDRYLSSIHIL